MKIFSIVGFLLAIIPGISYPMNPQPQQVSSSFEEKPPEYFYVNRSGKIGRYLHLVIYDNKHVYGVIHFVVNSSNTCLIEFTKKKINQRGVYELSPLFGDCPGYEEGTIKLNKHKEDRYFVTIVPKKVTDTSPVIKSFAIKHSREVFKSNSEFGYVLNQAEILNLDLYEYGKLIELERQKALKFNVDTGEFVEELSALDTAGAWHGFVLIGGYLAPAELIVWLSPMLFSGSYNFFGLISMGDDCKMLLSIRSDFNNKVIFDETNKKNRANGCPNPPFFTWPDKYGFLALSTNKNALKMSFSKKTNDFGQFVKYPISFALDRYLNNELQTDYDDYVNPPIGVWNDNLHTITFSPNKLELDYKLKLKINKEISKKRQLELEEYKRQEKEALRMRYQAEQAELEKQKAEKAKIRALHQRLAEQSRNEPQKKLNPLEIYASVVIGALALRELIPSDPYYGYGSSLNSCEMEAVKSVTRCDVEWLPCDSLGMNCNNYSAKCDKHSGSFFSCASIIEVSNPSPGYWFCQVDDKKNISRDLKSVVGKMCQQN
ncbi:hypothetical protein [Catenovulum agarivorans]|uniref:hypothetical protein n=1 Tax=Catenovulum agarivorans TaxID=1172192 RepID=UPI0002E3AA17|nr:hypothetical protein [Catenovulum agarivorans]